MVGYNFRYDELRLRDCISQLKTVRASIQSGIQEVEVASQDVSDKGISIAKSEHNR